MRKASEPFDDVPMTLRIFRNLGTAFVCEFAEERDGTSLVLQVFAVHKRHVEEVPLEGRQFPVETLLYGFSGNVECFVVRRVGSGIAPEQVARELVQQDHQRQTTLRFFLPPVVLAPRRPFVIVQESAAYLPVELLVLPELRLTELAVPFFTLAPEPKVQNLAGLTRHGSTR